MTGPATRAPPGPQPRPLIERLGLVAIALVVVGMFGAIAVAALAGGELFLGVMAGDRRADDPVGRRGDAAPGLSRRPSCPRTQLANAAYHPVTLRGPLWGAR